MEDTEEDLLSTDLPGAKLFSLDFVGAFEGAIALDSKNFEKHLYSENNGSVFYLLFHHAKCRELMYSY